jgi:hypothetical protein
VELVQACSLRDRRTFPSGHQCTQCLSLTATPGYRAALLGEHAPSSSNRVEGIRLAAGTTLATKSTDLEHSLLSLEQEPAQSRTERGRTLDREYTPARSVLTRNPKRLPVTVAVRRDRRFEHHDPGRDRNNC